MAANLEIGGAVKRTQKGDADWYYGGDNEAWASLAAAKAGVPAAVRPGKTVGVFVSGAIVEYWWPTAAVSDSDLIIKTPPIVTDTTPTSGSANPVQSGGVYTALNSKQDYLGYTAENTANKNVANGYAGLDGSGKVPSAILPSYVDDVLEYANLAALPATGETGKIYVTIDTNFEYRWSGSAYIRLVSSPGSTDALAEGATNLYYTAARVKAYADTLYASLTGSYSDPAWINSLSASKLTDDTLPANILHSILTTLGTIITGIWNASVIDPQYGGTGLASYTIGDLLYASGPATLSKLLAVATGNVLLSGGTGSAPSYGKVGLTTHITGTLPVTNGGTGTATALTPGSLIFAGPSGIYIQDNANLFYDATNFRLGLGTAVPTHTLSLNSTSTGTAQYNTVDQTTNYERFRTYWNNNIFTLTTERGGTGNERGFNLVGGVTSTIGINGRTMTITGIGIGVTGGFAFNSNTSASNASSISSVSSFTNTAGINQSIAILDTFTHSGTAGYRALWISPYESSVGTGNKYLIDAGLNSTALGAGTHTSKFSVDRVGNTIIGGNATITSIASAGGLVTTSSSGLLGYLASVAAGYVLVSNGIGNPPIYTSSPIFFQWYRAGNVSSINRGIGGYGIDSASATYLDISTATNGSVTNYNTVAFGGGTFSSTNTGITATNLSTVYIASAPTAGNNVTAANLYALQVASGNTYLSNNVGIGTAPTHSLTLGSAATGIAYYNTADQVANFERVRMYWTSNQFNIGYEAAGTAPTSRGISIAAASSIITLGGSGGVSNTITFNATSNAFITNGVYQFLGGATLNSSSLIQAYLSIFPGVNQTGTAGFRGLYLSAYITAQGSSSNQFLIDIGTNTAINGSGTHSSKFSVNYSGDTNIGGQLNVSGGPIVTASTFINAGNLYVSGFNTIIGASPASNWLFGGANSVQIRIGLGGTTIPTLAVGSSCTNTVISNTFYNTASSGTHAFVNSLSVLPVSLGTNNGASVTNTASLYIENAGTGGTNNYALYSAAGANYFGGKTNIGNATNFGYLNIGGAVTPVSQIGRLISVTGSVQATANNDALYGLDLTGITFSPTGGTSVGNISITNAGTGYTNGTYNNVTTTGGSGTGFIANIIVSGGVITQVTATTASLPGVGIGYVVGDVLTVSNSLIGGTGTGFTFTITQVIYASISTTHLRANSFLPSAANIGTIGSRSLYYSSISAGVASVNAITNLTGSSISVAASAIPNGTFFGSGNTLLSAGSQTDPGYRLGVNGNMLGNGTIIGSAGYARGMYLNHTLQASTNSDTLVGLDINNTADLGSSAITSLGTITPGSSYTNGTYTGVALSGGSGSGAIATIVVASGAVSSVTLVLKGTGYTVGNTLTCSVLPLGSGFSIPVATIGLTGASYLSLRTSGAAQVGGSLSLLTVGSKINIATGTNASIGTSTLVAGTVTVNTTAVSSSSIIMICRKATGGTIGGLTYGTIVAGTSFVITSDSLTDTSQVNWWILN